MFQIKDFASIAASQINIARANQDKITDFSVGSAARTLMDAPAAEIEELYHQMFSGLREAIPVAVYKSFNFARLPAHAASGFVTFSRSLADSASTLTIPRGTVVLSALGGAKYSTQSAVTLASGVVSTDVLVVCQTVGVSGNAVPLQINKLEQPINGAVTVSNLSTFANGTAEESDTQQAVRFAQYIASLSRSTVVALHYAARTATVVDTNGNVIEYVTRTGLDEIPGTVKLYLYANSGIPSTALLARCQQIMDGYRDPATNDIVQGWRAAGVEVRVLPMQERAVDVHLQVGLMWGRVLDSALQSQIRAAVDSVMRTVQSGDVLYAYALIDAVLSVPGVGRALLGTNDNVLCAASQVLVVGAFTITVM